MPSTAISHTFPAGSTLSLVQGDISLQQVDAIINPANAHLRHGGGVAAALVRRGGIAIQVESTRWVELHGPISHSRPAVTGPGSLACSMLIHVLGPVWGEGDEDRKLASAVGAALDCAAAHAASSVAMPAISTGIFGFPLAHAASIHLDAVERHYSGHPRSCVREVHLVLYDEVAWSSFAEAARLRWPKTVLTP